MSEQTCERTFYNVINFDTIPFIYKPHQHSCPEGKGFCTTCKKTMDIKSFFKSGRVDKYPLGVLPVCKTCAVMLVDDTDPLTFLSILKEADIPYISKEWAALLVKKERGAPSILGKYISKTKLSQFKNLRWADSAQIAEKEAAELLSAFRAVSLTETEAQEQVEATMTFAALKPVEEPVISHTDPFDLLSPEDQEKALFWGVDYNANQLAYLEAKYNSFAQMYSLEDPITADMIRKAVKLSLKADELLDINDIETAQKTLKAYQDLLKSANLTPAQQKDKANAAYSLGQFFADICRENGDFVKYEINAEDLDILDKVIEDMRSYTFDLIKSESGLTDMIMNAQQILSQDVRDAREMLEAFEETQELAAYEINYEADDFPLA